MVQEEIDDVLALMSLEYVKKCLGTGLAIIGNITLNKGASIIILLSVYRGLPIVTEPVRSEH